MNRHAVRSLMLVLALTGACGGNQTTNNSSDMASSSHDQGTSSDLSMISDLTSPPRDMSPPELTGVSCATATVTANTVYSTVIMTSCAGMGCHVGTGATETPMYGTSGATLIAATVNKPSSATMNYITANDLNHSYLLYKVYGQHLKVPMGSGGQMPEGGGMLSDPNLCLLVNWVRSGAK